MTDSIAHDIAIIIAMEKYMEKYNKKSVIFRNHLQATIM